MDTIETGHIQYSMHCFYCPQTCSFSILLDMYTHNSVYGISLPIADHGAVVFHAAF